jgi:glycosyltransferase involved in cell wall biosynthesis
VAIDAHDARMPMLHGSGIYARCLIEALRARADGQLRYEFLEGTGRGPELLWEQVGLPFRLRRLRPAVVHAPNCFLPLRRPCPGVVTVHDLAFEVHREDFSPRTGWKYRTFTRRSVRSAERVICASRFTAADVCRRYDVEPGRMRVVPLAPALPEGSIAPPEGPYLLAVGDLRPKKNLATLVRAWRALRADGLPHRLILAGQDLGQGPLLRRLAGDEPLELPGFVGDLQLDALLRGAAALVHPGLYEGFGLIVVEAMARGCPAVLANATALPETGRDAALYFDPTDSEELSREIRSLLEDRSLREGLIERGRERAGSLSWGATAAATEAVYRELL